MKMTLKGGVGCPAGGKDFLRRNRMPSGAHGPHLPLAGRGMVVAVVALLDVVATFYHEGERRERIEIFFSHHQVSVVGKNLAGTMNDIRAFEVRCLRDVPGNLHAAVDPTEPLIERLEVRPLNEPKKAATGSLPF